MSISGMMRTSASGMNAQSARLGTVSDNIANASTHGYKRAFTEFSTVVLESGSGAYVPGSVDTQIRYGITQQGGFDYTTSSTDLAVSGDGFFLVGDGNGSTVLTRAGSFVKVSNGDLVNAAGYTLQGYPMNGGTVAVSANGTTGLQNVNISALALEATPSTSGKFYVNVPEDAAIETTLPSSNDPAAAYSAKTSMTVIDNVGRETTLDIYYTKTAANTWEVSVFDASKADATTKSFPYDDATVPAPLFTDSLIFDPTTGQLDASSPTSISIDLSTINGGGTGGDLVLDIAESSELADDFQVLSSEVNGNKPSSVESVEFGTDGTLYAVYGNGARVATYRIPLATVPSPDNLTPGPGNTYSVSADSGNLQLGFPGTALFGTIRSSALEKSTVDTATELTTMIESQFAFTANSKVFQTGGELMEVLVNLKR